MLHDWCSKLQVSLQYIMVCSYTYCTACLVVESTLALEPRLTWTTMPTSATQTTMSTRAIRRDTLALEPRLTWTTMLIS